MVSCGRVLIDATIRLKDVAIAIVIIIIDCTQIYVIVAVEVVAKAH